jgi:hypothetical protein
MKGSTRLRIWNSVKAVVEVVAWPPGRGSVAGLPWTPA